MAKKYENVENVLKLLEDDGLGGVLKRLSSTEKNLAEIMKNLSVLEVEKAEREAAEAAAKAEAEAIAAAEEAAGATSILQLPQDRSPGLPKTAPRVRSARLFWS